jgi:hypothetical protein
MSLGGNFYLGALVAKTMNVYLSNLQIQVSIVVVVNQSNASVLQHQPTNFASPQKLQAIYNVLHCGFKVPVIEGMHCVDDDVDGVLLVFAGDGKPGAISGHECVRCDTRFPVLSLSIAHGPMYPSLIAQRRRYGRNREAQRGRRDGGGHYRPA